MLGTLYVVATPLGNLEDLSPRAAKILGEVDLIACEDTRHTRKLLNNFAIPTPTTSYHEHNEDAKAPALMIQLQEGKRIALVSDAGTPLLSGSRAPAGSGLPGKRDSRLPSSRSIGSHGRTLGFRSAGSSLSFHRFSSPPGCLATSNA